VSSGYGHDTTEMFTVLTLEAYQSTTVAYIAKHW